MILLFSHIQTSTASSYHCLLYVNCLTSIKSRFTTTTVRILVFGDFSQNELQDLPSILIVMNVEQSRFLEDMGFSHCGSLRNRLGLDTW